MAHSAPTVAELTLVRLRAWRERVPRELRPSVALNDLRPASTSEGETHHPAALEVGPGQLRNTNLSSLILSLRPGARGKPIDVHGSRKPGKCWTHCRTSTTTTIRTIAHTAPQRLTLERREHSVQAASFIVSGLRTDLRIRPRATTNAGPTQHQ